ncbi:NAD(P)/FAD-dependent oxidoreductase [Actibacterium sp. XHP0104]|uniref:NAD(P)/FAD-dependent oxidoreductase n=1 Tax=Actibacterium sp. XHP0104 TaxID=2984335 RepID=UPI0021E9040D|nr:NAD(P)/FAD-dependent oxidoreductase [Actibacterium sp. XHP0104]MCV2881214.1 NAD(P)/FAD-dependent oxidoreductase [Actibacterium sp. XHP0104]
MRHYDCIILGAGAAGLMCAGFTAARGAKVLIIDHAKAAGEKIRISGGGRCNFTNLYAGPENFISANPHFAKSALARYTQWDFIDLMARHGIAWHEKTLGQLFCDDSARQVVRMLLDEAASAELLLQTSAQTIAKAETGFAVTLSDGRAVLCDTLVVATGGKSIPKMGATGFGYQVAEQFGHRVLETRPALVPLTFGDRFAGLSGTALPARVSANGTAFDEAVLFTHRGLSGPAILQISSYWREGDGIVLNILPDTDPFQALRELRARAGARSIQTMLAELIPARLAAYLCDDWGLAGNLADYSDARLRDLAGQMAAWVLTPAGSEGYRTAEVTLGGVDTDGLNARTMESKTVPGLYFIGEVVDVTGWLGGFNFQWAWSSAHAAGTAIASRR